MKQVHQMSFPFSIAEGTTQTWIQTPRRKMRTTMMKTMMMRGLPHQHQHVSNVRTPSSSNGQKTRKIGWKKGQVVVGGQGNDKKRSAKTKQQQQQQKRPAGR